LKHLEIGQEETFDLYVTHLLECFREVRRVLRDDGTLWVNLGDRYTNAGRSTYDPKAKLMGRDESHPTAGSKRPADLPGLKKKELCLVPQRVAMALQADGWYLRSMIPWIKRNAMPESVGDRPINALEYVFLFSKTERYYYDRYSVLVPSSPNTHPRASVFPHRQVRDVDNNRRRRRTNPKAALEAIGSKQNPSFAQACSDYIPADRNRRNTDWFLESWQGLLTDEDGDPLALVVNPKGTTITHFAAYPPKLVEPIIRCATSEAGCCSACGAPLMRVVETVKPDLDKQKQSGGDLFGTYTGKAKKDFDGNGVQNASDVKRRILASMTIKKTRAWIPGCKCGAPAIPCTVLDPFSGTAVTLAAATALGRYSIGCDINESYIKSSDARDAQGALAVI
jgi:hypothetical protein